MDACVAGASSLRLLIHGARGYKDVFICLKRELVLTEKTLHQNYRQKQRVFEEAIPWILGVVLAPSVHKNRPIIT